MNTSTSLKVVGGLIVALAIIGAYFYPFAPAVQVTGASSAGTTFNSAKVATIEFSIATGGATSTSILNTDATDRIVESVKYNCTGLGTSFSGVVGAGIANLLLNAGTTSTPLPLPISNGVFLTNAIVPTSTPVAYLSSSTPGLSGTSGKDWARTWNTGSYLSFSTNATNTAQCLVGVGYLAS